MNNVHGGHGGEIRNHGARHMFGALNGCAQRNELVSHERHSDLLVNGLSNVAEGQVKLVMDAGIGAVLHDMTSRSIVYRSLCYKRIPRYMSSWLGVALQMMVIGALSDALR